jgi:rare lipoprotein A
MKLRFTIASSVAVVAVLGAAMADQMPGRADAGDKVTLIPQNGLGSKPMGDAMVQIAAVTQQVVQFASTAAIVVPLAEQPVVSTAPPVGNSSPPAKTAAAPHSGSEKLFAKPFDKANGRAARREDFAADPKPTLVRVVGLSETGKAAWYGGRYVGRRTSSGDRLDTIRPTAAHRTLPLNSLARVTNLKNGRSVIVKVTDRGPVSTALLIDMSPSAAEQLAMKDDGVVPVKVEQVVAVPPDTK